MYIFDHPHKPLIRGARMEGPSKLIDSVMQTAVVSAEPFVDVGIECLEVRDARLELGESFLVLLDD